MNYIYGLATVLGGVVAVIGIIDLLVIAYKMRKGKIVKNLIGKWLYKGSAKVNGVQRKIFGECEVMKDSIAFFPRGRFGEVRLKVKGKRIRTIEGESECQDCKLSLPFKDEDLSTYCNNCSVKNCEKTTQVWHSDCVNYLDDNLWFSYKFHLPAGQGDIRGLCDVHLDETKPLSLNGSLLRFPPHEKPGDIKFMKVLQI